MQSRQVITATMSETLAKNVIGLCLPISVKWTTGKLDCQEVVERTIPQNALLHQHFEKIAKHFGDRSAAQVKGECHMRWGVPIRLRNEQWAWIWERGTKGLTYEQKCKVCESGIFAISSGMSPKEAKEYIDEIYAEYLPKNVPLTVPEDKT